MKIGVLSDTHGRQLSLRRAIRAMKDVDLIFHLGDFITDALYIEKTEEIPIIYVPGNCDYSTNVDSSKLYQVKNNNIFLTHGHLYNVKYGYDDLIARARDLNVDIVLFGHTHIPKLFKVDDMLFINPGSLGIPPHGYKPTYAILEIEDDKVKSHLKNL